MACSVEGTETKGDIMKASALSFRLAVLFVIAGMAMGIGMAASGNHAIMPAHAHLNLLGWVSLFLFGTYYERRPALDRSRVARLQVSLWSAGTVILTVAVAAIHLGYAAFDPVAALASLLVLGAMLLFTYFIFKPTTWVVSEPSVHLTPAE
jgi:peptidoglycan/LPS O-acetylase OafA/YrhL